MHIVVFVLDGLEFVGMDEMKFAMQEGEQLVQYVREHPEITDVLFTGGDPMIMKAKMFSKYVDAIIESNLPNLKTIRIGTKSTFLLAIQIFD